ncbi:hypothetical protein [Chitinophaga sp. LS1]|uniref:hypothetical protein n=1 Tax=Chitinophaga sp. LS1 TaxID=3051176 RepID=UPI002AAABA81|nr:hypothetical protein [Chitinophaga sp. LS1]WPV65207.1 hypothetical protein QQL36_25715 [Chitinophaga sp. LS1]
MKHTYVGGLILISAFFFAACGKETTKSAPDTTPVSTTTVATDNSAQAGMVLTPGGWRPADKVSKIEQGQHLDVQGGRLRAIDDATGKVAKDFGAIHADAGAFPDYPGNVNSAAPLARKVKPLSSGWIAYTYWSNPVSTPISYFSTTWTVPPAPSTSNGQTIFMFNGLQNSSYILQPVLQWGPSAAGGGNYWAIANWYVDGSSGTAIFSNLVRVSAGTSLTGIMTLTGSSGSTYSYTSAFTGYSSINLSVSNIQKLYWAAESLEVYYPVVCTDYPNTTKTTFSNIQIQLQGGTQSALSWTVANAVTDCGQHASVVTNGTPNGVVDIYY